MTNRAYGYHSPVRYSGPEVSEEIMLFLSAIIGLALDNYFPGRNHDLYKVEFGKTVITLKIVPNPAGRPGDRISIRVRRDLARTQLFAAIKKPKSGPANDVWPPAKGRIFN